MTTDPEQGSTTAPRHVSSGVPGDAIRVEQVRILYRSPAPALANPAIGGLLAVIAWGHLPASAILGWLLAMVAATAVRVWLWVLFRRHEGPVDARLWELRMILAVTVAGAVWASLGLAVAVGQLPVHVQGGIAISCGGMLAGAIFSMTASPRAFRAYVLPTAIGPILGFVAVGDVDHQAVAAMGGVYLIVVLLWGRDLGRSIATGIQLRLENQALIADLKATRDAAEAADRLKRESFANLGHELRTPLNAIIGFAQSLRAEIWGPLGNPRYSEYARAIDDSGRHLFVLIQDILDLSKHDAGILELDEAPVDLTALVRGCREMLSDSALAAGVALEAETPEAALLVVGDVTKLRQITINLLSNAIRFTPSGGQVAIAVRRLDGGETRIRVSDTGIGLAAEDIPRAFEPFVQVSRDRTRDSGGAGLGLPLSKRLAELHGGALNIRSQPGEGTVVEVVLPATRALDGDKPPI